jgi:hypothetical protein
MTTMNEKYDEFEKYASNPETWLSEASRHISVWKVLSTHTEKLLVKGGYQVEEYAGCRKAALFHAGIAIENALKANLVQQDPTIISNGTIDKSKFGNKGGHGLVGLANRVLPKLSSKEQRLLRKLEENVFWAGKYSVPSKAETLYDREIKTSLRLAFYGEQEVLQGLYDTLVRLIENVPLPPEA